MTFTCADRREYRRKADVYEQAAPHPEHRFARFAEALRNFADQPVTCRGEACACVVSAR